MFSSLRLQLAWVISILSLIPAIAVVGTIVLLIPGGLTQMLPVMRDVLVVVVVAMIALSSVVGLWAASILTAPLSALKDAVRSVSDATPGVYAGRIVVPSSDPLEVRELARAFSDQLAQIKRERDRRGTVVAMLLHDLNTPILAVATALQMVAEGGGTRADAEALLSRTRQEVDRVAVAIQSIVDYERLELVPLSPRRSTVDLREVVDSTIETVKLSVGRSNVQISVDGRGSARVDRTLAGRCIENLVVNAARHARSNVTVSVHRSMVRIQDDGPGLSAPLETLIQAFVGASSVSSEFGRSSVGLAGLGLAISSAVLEAHGGRLVQESSTTAGTVLLAYFGEEVA